MVLWSRTWKTHNLSANVQCGRNGFCRSPQPPFQQKPAATEHSQYAGHFVKCLQTLSHSGLSALNDIGMNNLILQMRELKSRGVITTLNDAGSL